MTRADDPLRELLDRIADGGAIDWDRAGGTDAPLLDALYTLDAVRNAYQRIGAAEAPHTQALFHWGHLAVLEKIGSGATAEVFRAWDPGLSTTVALELLRPEAAAAGLRSQEFLREGRLLARLSQRNVLRVYGAAVHDGRPASGTNGSKAARWMRSSRRTVPSRATEAVAHRTRALRGSRRDPCGGTAARRRQGQQRDARARRAHRADRSWRGRRAGRARCVAAHAGDAGLSSRRNRHDGAPRSRATICTRSAFCCISWSAERIRATVRSRARNSAEYRTGSRRGHRSRTGSATGQTFFRCAGSRRRIARESRPGRFICKVQSQRGRVDDLQIASAHGRSGHRQHGPSIDSRHDRRPFRELTPEVMAKPAHLFTIAPARGFYLLPGFADWTGKGTFRGENPPEGALLTFWVKDFTGDEVKIAITNSAGQPVANLKGRGCARLGPGELGSSSDRRCAD